MNPRHAAVKIVLHFLGLIQAVLLGDESAKKHWERQADMEEVVSIVAMYLAAIIQ